MSQANGIHLSNEQITQIHRILFYELSIQPVLLEGQITYILKTLRSLYKKNTLSKYDLYKIMYPHSHLDSEKREIESALLNLHMQETILLEEDAEYITYILK